MDAVQGLISEEWKKGAKLWMADKCAMEMKKKCRMMKNWMIVQRMQMNDLDSVR